MMTAKRPRLLWFLFIMLIAQSGLYLSLAAQYVRAVQLLSQLNGWVEHGLESPESLITLWLFLITWGGVGGASLLIALLLRTGRNWVWTAAQIVDGVILILTLEQYLERTATPISYSGMFLAIAITFLLNQREIQIFFHAQRTQPLEGRFGQ